SRWCCIGSIAWYIIQLYACYFFFQAEDGIRDRNVTGVQTCALPIWGSAGQRDRRERRGVGRGRRSWPAGPDRPPSHASLRRVLRSEERRVGKESRPTRKAEQEREGKAQRGAEARRRGTHMREERRQR